MRVAIVHYWFVAMRGGEKVVEALCDIFPNADLFTHVYDESAVSEKIRAHRVFTTFINRLPRAKRMYKRYLPLMPMALENLDLRRYDLIISSESGPAKGIIPPPGSVHLCYCHSPMRYVWNMYHDYRDASGRLTRWMMPPLAHYVRNWDTLSATRVDRFIANSETTRQRIQRYYRRRADVIYPPVSVNDFSMAPESERADYYLIVGELVRYKRMDLAIAAFNRMNKKLIVIGGGESLHHLRKMAGPTVAVLGQQPLEVLRRHYSRCRALVFPGEEDFGIVPVEAMASGRPVIAFKRGGVAETVVEGESGVFFEEQSVESLVHAVEAFETMSFSPERIRLNALRFSADLFRRNMEAVVAEVL